MKELIETIVKSFYTKAVQDPIIGYHFRKIQEFESNDFLKPPIEAFANHLPRINSFWELQLLGIPLPHSEKLFNLIQIHQYLQLKPGEVGRWITLFEETLHEYETENNREFLDQWKDKLEVFKKKFLSSPYLFSS